MQTHTTPITAVYADDGSYVIDTGDGIVFGPYGPGTCAATHPGGFRCHHMTNHGGCHTDDTNADFTFRWFG